MDMRGDVASLTKLVKLIANRLEPMYVDNTLLGYAAVILNNSEKIEEMVLDEEDIRFIFEGVLPVIWVSITFQPDKAENVRPHILKMEKEFNLRMITGHAH